MDNNITEEKANAHLKIWIKQNLENLDFGALSKIVDVIKPYSKNFNHHINTMKPENKLKLKNLLNERISK